MATASTLSMASLTTAVERESVEPLRKKSPSVHPPQKNSVRHPLSSEYGTCKTVKARIWLWHSGKNILNVLSYSLLARAIGKVLL
jgi:hypothetical protein